MPWLTRKVEITEQWSVVNTVPNMIHTPEEIPGWEEIPREIQDKTRCSSHKVVFNETWLKVQSLRSERQQKLMTDLRMSSAWRERKEQVQELLIQTQALGYRYKLPLDDQTLEQLHDLKIDLELVIESLSPYRGKTCAVCYKLICHSQMIFHLDNSQEYEPAETRMEVYCLTCMRAEKHYSDWIGLMFINGMRHRENKFGGVDDMTLQVRKRKNWLTSLKMIPSLQEWMTAHRSGSLNALMQIYEEKKKG